MAQFHWIGTSEDNLELLQAILERGDIEMIWSQRFATSEPKRFASTSQELLNLLKEAPSLYLLGSYSVFPLVLREDDDADCPAGERYFLGQDGGGPLIHFSFPSGFRHKGKWSLGLGMISYSRNGFLDPLSGAYRKATPELKAAYADMVKRMKRHMVKHTINKTVWVGRRALELLKSGKARVIAKGI